MIVHYEEEKKRSILVKEVQADKKRTNSSKNRPRGGKEKHCCHSDVKIGSIACHSHEPRVAGAGEGKRGDGQKDGGPAVHWEGKSRKGNRRGKMLVPASDILKQASHAVSVMVRSGTTRKRGASLKSLTLGPQVKQKKAVYKVTVETLKYYRVLKDIMTRCSLDSIENISDATLIVLVREILLGSGLSRVAEAERLVLQKESELQQALHELMKEKDVKQVHELLPINSLEEIARNRAKTVRVNLVKCTVEEAKSHLEDDVSCWNHCHNCYYDLFFNFDRVSNCSCSHAWEM